MKEKEIENRKAGFTLIEILIAMLMSLIIISGVVQFMQVATTNYQAVDKQVNLQVEAQSTINAISDMILEANNVSVDGDYLHIYYNVGLPTSVSGGAVTREGAEQKIIWFDSAHSKLYLFNCNSATEYSAAKSSSHTGKQLLAEGVHSVQYKIPSASGTGTALTNSGLSTTGQNKPTVEISVELWSKATSQSTKEDDFTYVATDTVAPRNEIVAIP